MKSGRVADASQIHNPKAPLLKAYVSALLFLTCWTAGNTVGDPFRDMKKDALAVGDRWHRSIPRCLEEPRTIRCNPRNDCRCAKTAFSRRASVVYQGPQSIASKVLRAGAGWTKSTQVINVTFSPSNRNSSHRDKGVLIISWLDDHVKYCSSALKDAHL
jgi:hypothetical protein